MRPLSWFPGIAGDATHRFASTRLSIDSLEDRTVPAVLDLTGRGAVASSGGVFFAQHSASSGDSSQAQTFLRLDGPFLLAGSTQGYNTDARPLQHDANASATRSLNKSEIPVVTVGGVAYREFVLDVSQLTLLTPRVSLDQLRLYVGETSTVAGYSAAGGTLGGLTPAYDLDAGGDSRVVLDARLSSSAGGDMRMYVPDSKLEGGEFVYLYSKFGEHLAPMNASQRWAVMRSDSPAPPPDSPPPPPPPPAGTAAIGGTIYADLNGNSMQEDHEYGLQDRIVYLDTDDDGQLDDGEPVVTSDADGQYSFSGLMAGTTYRVRVVTGAGEFALPAEATPGADEFVLVDIGVEGNTPT